MRVYELAARLGVTPGRIMDILSSLGLEAVSNRNRLEEETVARVEGRLQEEGEGPEGSDRDERDPFATAEGKEEREVESQEEPAEGEEEEETGRAEAPRFPDGHIVVLGGHQSGKSAYLFVLGDVRVKEKMGRWTIGRRSKGFVKFLNAKRAQLNDWRPTDWRTLEEFSLFSVRDREHNMELQLSAFDTAGENFDVAFNPYERERRPSEEEREIFDKVRKMVLGASAYIILINGELADPEYVQRMQEEGERVATFLDNFHSTLENEGGKLEQKPVAFVLTKGDLFYDDEYLSEKRALDRFGALMEWAVTWNLLDADEEYKAKYEDCRRRTVREGRQEAEKFFAARFPKAYEHSRLFPNRQYFVISCWGFEPEYYAGKRPNEEPVSRRSVWKIRKEKEEQRQPADIRIRVAKVQPVCVEEPLEWVLDGLAEQREQRREQKRQEEEKRRREAAEKEKEDRRKRRRRRVKRDLRAAILLVVVLFGAYWGPWLVGDFCLHSRFCRYPHVTEIMCDLSQPYRAYVYRPVCERYGLPLGQDAFGLLLLDLARNYQARGDFDKALSTLDKAVDAGLPEQTAAWERESIERRQRRVRTWDREAF